VGVGDSSDRVLHTIDSGRRIVELGLGFRQSKTGVGNLLSVARSEC
jgi:leucyl aminopeptidase (aminopeptidase T)